MSQLTLFLLVVAASKLVFVASETCTKSEDCEEVGSCCYDGVCTTDTLTCRLKEKQRKLICCLAGTCDCNQKQQEDTTTCYANWQCRYGGCCVDSICQPASNWQCQKSCTYNWQCTSGCCKNNKCQATKSVCNICYNNWDCVSGCCKYNQCYDDCYPTTEYYTTTAPSSCWKDYECGYDECCVDGKCGSCPTTYPWRKVSTTSGYDGNDDYYDGYGEGSDSSSSGLGVGPSIGIAVAAIVVVILKLSLWGCCYARRRQRVILVRRRITCVRVPIVDQDQLQREYERTERGAPARLPPAYSPRPFQNNNENSPLGPPPVYTPVPSASPNEATESAQTQTVPPPAYPVHQNEAQTLLTQGTGMTGNATQANGIPQSTNPTTTLPNTSQNATDENPKENTMGPFLI